jgi:D-methionine transport system permease protein
VFSEMFYKLWDKGLIQMGIWETLYMTLIASAAAYLIGLPLGVVLTVTDEGGIHPIRWLNKALGLIVNFFRSIPFVILMVAMLPVAKVIVGTSLGNKAMIVMLIIAAAPYVARMVESSVKEVGAGVIEAAQSMGASNFQIVRKVLLPEAKPSLILGAVISMVTILGYSAMASTIGGTGLGQIAIIYGHQRSNDDITWICVFLTVIIVQIIQEAGMRIAHRTDKRIKQ